MPNKPIVGRGWGDGVAVAAFNARRRRNPENTYTGFRPRVANEAAYFVIRKWCDDPIINKSFSAVINALLPSIKVAMEQSTEVNEETGQISIDCNFGRIDITQ